MSDRKRLLNELRVIDLRAELDKRNLDKNGVRGVLIQRLSKYLEAEGHDPTTYRIDLSGFEGKTTPTKRTRHTESSTEEVLSEEAPAMEDMIVRDDAGDEDGAHLVQTSAKHNRAQVPSSAEEMEVDEVKFNRKRENKDEVEEVSDAKKLCLDKDDDHKNENNTDADDSINLDIGDDELLNEETDSTTKSKKDDGAHEDAVECGEDEAAADHSAAATDAVPADAHQNKNDAPATSNEAGAGEKGGKDVRHRDGEGEREKKKEDSKEGGARNLWVSGLSSDTRAKDLKQLCSNHGKVIGAKVVTNARTPGSRCYGYVTMASPQDAENCIKNLHRTELHGRMISVEKAKSESESSSRRQTTRLERRFSKDRRDDGKENEECKDDKGDSKQKKDVESCGDSQRSSSRTREKSHRSDRGDRTRRSTRSHERRRSPREKERDVARARERGRAAREEERRRRAAEEVLRERERRQRQEKHRLALEREKLRAEREKIEREKNELLRLERERHRLEREKLELERLELKRAQLRLEEERRKRGYESNVYRKPASSPLPEPAYERDTRHKRAPPPPPMSSSRGQFEAPPPPRFEMSSNYDRTNEKRDRDRDYKRDYPRHVPSGNMKYPSNGSSNDDARQPMPPGTRPKEPSRSYDSRDNRPYRPSPPTKPEPRNWNSSSRYPDAAPSKGSGVGGNETWSGGEPRYGGGGAYETRYAPAYQPPPPGAPYPDRYAPPPRDYRKY